MKSGHDAAVAAVRLMSSTVKRLPPMQVIEAFHPPAGKNRIAHMWEETGTATLACMADGCRRLAELWVSAWKEGNGNAIPSSKLRAISKDTLMNLYNKPKFLEAFNLKEMVEKGIGIPA